MSYSSEVLADSPAAYYRCSEASGLIQDSSGNARHATGSDGTAQYQQTGPIASEPSDKAIYFDGDVYFTVPDVGLDFGDTLSLEFWIKRTTTGIDEAVISKGSLGYAAYFKAADNKLYFAADGDIDIANYNVAITDTDWHYCVITKNGTGANCALIYIDGVEDTNLLFDTIAIEDTATALYIGQSAFSGSVCNSYLDEIALYDGVLSAADVAAHYAAATAAAERIYKRLYGPAQLTGSAADLYTCPASTVARTLHIHASNPSGSPVDANLSIGTDAAGTRIWDDLAIPADDVVDVFDPYELTAGEVIQGWADTAGTVVVSITGYEDPV